MMCRPSHSSPRIQAEATSARPVSMPIPAGPCAIYSLSAPPNLLLQYGVDPFASSTVPILGVLAVNQDLRTPCVENYNFNIQEGLWSGAVLQAGSVGSGGRKLIYTRDINAAVPGTGSVQSRRPYNSQYPTLGAINELESAANAQYNSASAVDTKAVERCHGHACVYVEQVNGQCIGSLQRRPQLQRQSQSRSWPFRLDTKHIFTGFVSYDVLSFTSHLKILTQGWQINALATAHTGLPILFRAGTDVNGDGDTFDRTNLVGDPFASLPPQSGTTSPVWVNKAAFASAPAGTLGNLGRDAIYGPGFFTIDPTAFKEFRINERFKAQFRAEFQRVELDQLCQPYRYV